MLDSPALDVLFREARTPAGWAADPVSDAELHALYDLVKLGPTSANCTPARFVFVRTQSGKAKLAPALSAGNVDKVMAAPVMVIVATDPAFFTHLPRLLPGVDAQAWFAANPALAEETALRNATLQGGYLILAARALGLSAWPMSGFDRHAVDAAFFADSGWRANFLVALGHADGAELPPRAPRLAFDEACVMA